MPLVAPYCVMLRDYLSDTPLLRTVGFVVSQHGQLGAIPPPPFLGISPLESVRRSRYPPPPRKRGISAILARHHMKTKQNTCDTPLCDTISQGYCAVWGGISHWAAKSVPKPSGREARPAPRRQTTRHPGAVGDIGLCSCWVKTFRGATEASQPDLPVWTRPSPNPPPPEILA